MPAPEVPVTPNYPRPIVGHVNLMVDTYLANATVDDLRSAVRGLLASGATSASQFSIAARKHLFESGALVPPNPGSLFVLDPRNGEATPTQTLLDLVPRARTVYGVGMGFASLEILIPIVEATIDAKWAEDGRTAELLMEVDADIVQAIQSCKEELETNRVKDRSTARQIVSKLQCAIHDSSRGGKLPFEKAGYGIQYWKF